jgi:hypothetical protein
VVPLERIGWLINARPRLRGQGGRRRLARPRAAVPWRAGPDPGRVVPRGPAHSQEDPVDPTGTASSTTTSGTTASATAASATAASRQPVLR